MDKEIQNAEIVVWEDKYATGIQLIDNQHKELVNLTNQLFRACMGSEDELQTLFKEAMSRMVEYVRFHFGAEQKLLEAIGYPEFQNHKKLHEGLVSNILEAVKDQKEGKKFVPNHFVRTLRDWVFSHIAVEDKKYAFYVAGLKKKGLLTDQQIESVKI
ncbi:MAG: bacteriohemerythrin [Treponema sp.]|jgi:hemerythrin|nr:bacteriohemerythrin [Treponema sp.]